MHNLRFKFLIFLVGISNILQAGEWSSATIVNKIYIVDDPSMAVDPKGNAIVAWEQKSAKGMSIMVATKPAEKKWSVPLALSTISKSEDISLPLVKIDREGNAMACWRKEKTANFAYLPFKGETWIEYPSIKDAPLEWPAFEFDTQGNVLAIWRKFNKVSLNNASIQCARFMRGSQSWTPVNTIPTGTGAWHIQIAFDPFGNAVMIWEQEWTTIQVATLSKDSNTWSRPTILFEGEGESPEVAVNTKGDVIACWIGSDETEMDKIHSAILLSGSTEWKKMEISENSAKGQGFCALAIDPAGNALFIWNSYGIVKSSKFLFKEMTWTTPIDLLPLDESLGANAFGMDFAGNAVFIWENDSETSPKSLLKVTTLPFNSKDGWTKPETILACNTLGGCHRRLLFSADGTCYFSYYEEIPYSYYSLKSLIGKKLFAKSQKPTKPKGKRNKT